MKKSIKKYLLIVTILVITSCTVPKDLHKITNNVPSSATIPVPRAIEHKWMSLKEWQDRHQEDVKIANSGNVDLLFLGDSITEGWGWGDNQIIFNSHFKQYHTANFGIGGDQTQHVLWRLQNGATGKLQPKVIVLMIGVNNFGHSHHSATDVFSGVKAIIHQTSQFFPNTKVLLHAILPYDQLATSPNRQKVIEANRLIATLADNQHVFYYDFGEIFLDENNDIAKERMDDFLHPSHLGYQLFANKIAPIIDRLMEP